MIPFRACPFRLSTVANFCYLYVSDTRPQPKAEGSTPSMRCIGVGRHDVPFAFKLLMSADPEAIQVPRPGSHKSFNVIAQREPGVARLLAFLEQIEMPHAQPLIRDTIAFLARPELQGSFFVLDPSDIFIMDDGPSKQQTARLIDEIRTIDSAIEERLAWVREPLGPVTLAAPPRGWVARLFGMPPRPGHVLPGPDPVYRLEQLGLTGWET